ncbi:hypothetical protein FHT82_000002 [Rhizobium sp. BK275]|nr:hypothetical protein [Rhizobium sp. BK275]
MQANNREAAAVQAPDELGVVDGSTYGAELRAIMDRSFCLAERYRAQQARADRAGSHPDIVEFERRFTARFRKLGVPMFAHCFVRGMVEQDSLFAAGLSKAHGGQSPHNYGLAVDIVHGTKAWDLTRKQWELVGHVGHEVARQLGVNVEWGGDWKFYDPAHWEIANWRDIGTSWYEPLRTPEGRV